MFWKRLTRAETPDPAQEEQEAAMALEASRRLNRLVGRQREEGDSADNQHDEIGAKIRSAFAENGFFLLGAPMNATASDLQYAVEDLSFAEDIDPQVLAQAQAELLSPRDRLAHELGWLPGCDEEFQKRVCDAVKAGDYETVDTLRFSAAGLARLNLACALLEAKPGHEAALANLLADFMRWDVYETQSRIDEARLNAGLRAGDDAHYSSAVSARRGAIADSIAQSAAATREGRQALAKAIFDAREMSSAVANLALESVLAAYGRIVDPRLQNMQSKMEDSIAALKADPNQAAQVTMIITTLDQWSQLRLPLQKLEQARGLDDPLSAELFSKMRDLGIELANEHKLYAETMRLLKALKQAFASVPSVQPMLERDLPTLIGNIQTERMVSLAEDILQNIRKFCAELRNEPFDFGTTGFRSARLLDSFDQMTEALPDAPEPYELVRSIAIACNNKGGAPALALQMIEFLLDQNPPASVGPQLTQDMCKLQKMINER